MSKWDAVVKAMEKEGLNKSIVPADSVYLSTGLPNLDYIISGKYVGGGFRSGRIVEIFGPPSAGKTQISTNVMIQAQLAEGAARFEDHEKTFEERLAADFGLDLTPGPFSYAKPRTFEESLDNTVHWMTLYRDKAVIEPTAPMVVIFDSLASMVPAAKIEDFEKKKSGAGANMRSKLSLATATSQEFPAFVNFVEENNVLAVFLNQSREKPGVMYGDPTYTPGGNAPEFFASTRIKLSRKILVDEKTKQKIGQKITAETVKNKTYRPWLKTSWFFLFRPDGTGYIDVHQSMIEHLLERGAIERPTAQTYVWEGNAYKRGALSNAIVKDPDGMAKMIEICTKLGDITSSPPVIEGDEAEVVDEV